MAGVSSESLTAALVALEAKLPFASLQLAKELFGILGTVDSSAGLRRALTDPSRCGDEKSALIKQLFGGKVSADAVGYRGGLAGSRWASARDIGDALETLAASVVIAVAENKSAVSASGITGLEALENDLFSFNQAVESNHEVQRACPNRRPARLPRFHPRREARAQCQRGSEGPHRAGGLAAAWLKVTKLVASFRRAGSQAPAALDCNGQCHPSADGDADQPPPGGAERPLRARAQDQHER